MLKPAPSPTLDAPSTALLEAAIEAPRRASPHAHERRNRRVAVTAGPCLRGRDPPPAPPVPFDAWGFPVPTYGRRSGHDVPKRRVVMAVYRPT